MLVFTDFVQNVDIQYMGGWSLISLTLLNILVNIVIIGRESLMNLKTSIMQCKRKACEIFAKHIVPLFKRNRKDQVQKFTDTD